MNGNSRIFLLFAKPPAIFRFHPGSFNFPANSRFSRSLDTLSPLNIQYKRHTIMWEKIDP